LAFYYYFDSKILEHKQMVKLFFNSLFALGEFCQCA